MGGGFGLLFLLEKRSMTAVRAGGVVRDRVGMTGCRCRDVLREGKKLLRRDQGGVSFLGSLQVLLGIFSCDCV